MEPIELSKQLLEDVRNGESHSEILREIKEIDRDRLENKLDTDAKKKAFWINFYNAESQLIVEEHPILHRMKLVFSIPFSHVAGKRLSLNKIEYGILRRSRSIIGTKKHFEPRFEKRFRVDKVDPRIHFALNCGSESCPAIRFYEAEKIDEQLDAATENYLSQTVEMEGDVIKVPKMFDWFDADFGGIHGVREFLEYYGYTDFDRIQYKKFVWTQDTRDFSEQPDSGAVSEQS